MNILVIGNGFDLALGLPTKYTDFLRFAEASKIIYNHENCEAKRKPIDCLGEMKQRITKCPNEEIKTKFINAEKLFYRFQNAIEHIFAFKACMDFHQCIYNNRWIEYFQERYAQRLMGGENWIDLEAEIKKVIKNLEGGIFEIIEREAYKYELEATHQPIMKIMDDVNKYKSNGNRYQIPAQAYRELVKSLREEFNRFIMALGIYLDFFIRCLDEEFTISRDIYNLLQKKKIDCVLSFNYINNFNKKYSDIPIAEDNTCYVHGSVQYWHELKNSYNQSIPLGDIMIEHLIENNAMIIGFDEYLSNENEEQLDFVYYRKYFQRISKGTGSQYLEWLDEYKTELKKHNIALKSEETWEEAYSRMVDRAAEKKPNHVFIFGHSMDATDKDIFRDIFLRTPNDTKVTIFYHDEDAHDRIIMNLIRILSKEVLIQKTHGMNPDIEFKYQSHWQE